MESIQGFRYEINSRWAIRLVDAVNSWGELTSGCQFGRHQVPFIYSIPNSHQTGIFSWQLYGFSEGFFSDQIYGDFESIFSN
jgi:hypothetical protein